tara:strand:+ start:123 stop:536 length:414 start_codon:yes stop_codon:yes gene_type:complete
MKHIKSYEQFLTEAEDTAKEIEAKVNKMGEVSDDEKEMEKDMKSASEGPTTPEEGTKSEKDNETKEEKDEKKGEDHIGEGMSEDHEEIDSKILKMGLGDLLDIMQKNDPEGYKDMEMYIKKNLSKSADESWFTTMTA